MWPVREVGLRDAPALARLHKVSFSHGWEEEDFERLLANRAVTCLAAASSGESRGFAGFVLFSRAADQAEIITLCVAPRFRRKGVAAALMAHCIAMLEASGAQSLFLEVAEDNTAALGLYAMLGFVEVGRRPRYYDTGPGGGDKPALVLRLEISQ